MRFVRYVLVAAAALLVYLGVEGIPPFDNWSLNSLFLAVIILAVLFLGFERGDYGAREIAVVGALAVWDLEGEVPPGTGRRSLRRL